MFSERLHANLVVQDETRNTNVQILQESADGKNIVKYQLYAKLGSKQFMWMYQPRNMKSCEPPTAVVSSFAQAENVQIYAPNDTFQLQKCSVKMTPIRVTTLGERN